MGGKFRFNLSWARLNTRSASALLDDAIYDDLCDERKDVRDVKGDFQKLSFEYETSEKKQPGKKPKRETVACADKKNIRRIRRAARSEGVDVQ